MDREIGSWLEVEGKSYGREPQSTGYRRSWIRLEFGMAVEFGTGLRALVVGDGSDMNAGSEALVEREEASRLSPLPPYNDANQTTIEVMRE
ncbi:hypothetical protein MA16_Dca017192 [Dendrobium catenatum]|uniref:Uncharacterized protein n=1 Tax=Dendrobium catenatum TaxID=906689 RepID=A0A2I0XAT0_9ASPA|nr:hypothetical protein MA16_Dca017192 [Dendrobium catenatum]